MVLGTSGGVEKRGREGETACSSWSSLQVPRARSTGEVGASVGSIHPRVIAPAEAKELEELYSSYQSLDRAILREGSTA